MYKGLGVTAKTKSGQAGINFSLYSSQAEKVELCLFDKDGNETRHKMRQDKKQVWSCWLADIPQGTEYGYRLYPKATEKSTEKTKAVICNPQKLMLDPYAKKVVGKPDLSTEENRTWFSLKDNKDNAKVAPKAVVYTESEFNWRGDSHPKNPWEETVIYEMHVKGFSQLNKNLPEPLRGTYAGLGHPKSVAYLKELGVTAVELLPVNFFLSEVHLQEKGLVNYWGYNPLAMFALDPTYSATDNPEKEFKQMVQALHQSGIEVILDVVFNHTTESNAEHCAFSQKGIDNDTYYWQTEQGEYLNWTGCGNMLNLSNDVTRAWIMDCLRYWVTEYHIDGFRFDLATNLGRETPYFNPQATLLQEMKTDKVLRHCKLISESWDMGEGGYQVGQFPAEFAEWNDRFRDDFRHFWIWQSGNLGAFAERFAGSSDLFRKADQHPHKTINFITAHDGFTLRDLVSYNHKHNFANGEENRDGRDENISYNYGVEGCTKALEEPKKTAVENQRVLASLVMLKTLLLSNGTPMLLAGDEFGNTQYGNNNVYCQDNEMGWLKWDNFNRTLFDATKAFIQLRKQIQSLMKDEWWTENNVAWLNANGQPMDVSDWQNNTPKAMQILLDDQWLCVINGKTSEQTFQLPQGNWRLFERSSISAESGEYKMHNLGFDVLKKY